MDAPKVTIDLDRAGGLSGHGYQLSISHTDPDGGGHGYRLFGPKYIGDSTRLRSTTLNQRDAREVFAYIQPLLGEDWLAEQIEPAVEPTRFEVGDRVVHPEHGCGEVIVAFDDQPGAVGVAFDDEVERGVPVGLLTREREYDRFVAKWRHFGGWDPKAEEVEMLLAEIARLRGGN